MKKALSISSLVAATFVLLVFAIVPHHHHQDGGTCIAISHCEKQHNNDCSNNHSHSCDDSCLAATDFLISEQSHTDSRCKIDGLAIDGIGGHLHVSFILLSAHTNIVPPPDEISVEFLWGDFHARTYISAISSAAGMRAPPAA